MLEGPWWFILLLFANLFVGSWLDLNFPDNPPKQGSIAQLGGGARCKLANPKHLRPKVFLFYA
jgi:hypothetical protein